MNYPAVKTTDRSDIGQEMYALIKELYPICRSITGNAVRETLNLSHMSRALGRSDPGRYTPPTISLPILSAR